MVHSEELFLFRIGQQKQMIMNIRLFGLIISNQKLNYTDQQKNIKTIENGYLHILFNGVKYNVQGAVVK